MYSERIRLPALLDKVMSASDAAALIEDGMTVGMSGFTRAGEAKAVPRALAERARRQPLQISLMTGASLGNDLDKQLTEAGVLARRMPFQVDPTLRRAINAGEVMFVDQHLSDTVEQIRNGWVLARSARARGTALASPARVKPLMPTVMPSLISSAACAASITLSSKEGRRTRSRYMGITPAVGKNRAAF